MTSAANRDATSAAAAVFPEAVGPKIASTKRPCMPRLWCLHPRGRADTSHMKVPRIFGGRTHMDRQPRELVAFILLGAALSAAAVVGVSWAAGFGAVSDRFQHVDAAWLPLALAAEVLAYVGYVLAYREVARVEDGPRLAHSRALALVATGFGVFIARGGFSVDLHAFRQEFVSDREARVRVLGLGALEGHFPSVAPLLIGYATGYALTRRTLPLAGAGAVEALLPFALLWTGTPLAAAVTAVLAYRIVNFWLPIVPAVFGLRSLRAAHAD